MALFIFCVFSEKKKKKVVGLTQFQSTDLESYFRKGKVQNSLGFHYKCFLGHY